MLPGVCKSKLLDDKHGLEILLKFLVKFKIPKELPSADPVDVHSAFLHILYNPSTFLNQETPKQSLGPWNAISFSPPPDSFVINTFNFWEFVSFILLPAL